MSRWENVRDIAQSTLILAVLKYTHGVVDHVYYDGLAHIIDTTRHCVMQRDCWGEMQSLPGAFLTQTRETLDPQHFFENLFDIKGTLIGAAMWGGFKAYELYQMADNSANFATFTIIAIQPITHVYYQAFVAPSLPIESITHWLALPILSWLPRSEVGTNAITLWHSYDALHTLGHCWEFYSHIFDRKDEPDEVVCIVD
jgi:hypothetical protein